MELKELEDDKAIKEKLQNVRDSVRKIENILDIAKKVDTSKLSVKDKIDFDLFLAYALNSLFWMYMRTKGQDPNNHDVKDQLQRIKDYMVKAKQAHDRKTIRPTLDKPAAGRFIRNGLNNYEEAQPLNKKIKFS
ncbi:hypothetical protein ABEB36_001426 [Hypothenemus hampei]|uniref:Nuclear nucleic acid-binding protein C1D n=1 Tax=Hypothenemus hampei TaxID=57062 RepID=A0ABD1FHQ9_HYPHA